MVFLTRYLMCTFGDMRYYVNGYHNKGEMRYYVNGYYNKGEMRYYVNG